MTTIELWHCKPDDKDFEKQIWSEKDKIDYCLQAKFEWKDEKWGMAFCVTKEHTAEDIAREKKNIIDGCKRILYCFQKGIDPNSAYIVFHTKVEEEKALEEMKDYEVQDKGWK